MEKITIMGHVVAYDEDAHPGLKYLLNKLDDEERRVFFDQAKSKGHAAFEDNFGHRYNLEHTGFGYQLTKVTN